MKLHLTLSIFLIVEHSLNIKQNGLVMIIYMTIDDQHLDRAVKLAKKYYPNDKIKKISQFKNNCFQDCDSTRITFLGHGGRTKFANYDAEDFVDKLVSENSLYKLPSTVTDIDIVACSVGFPEKNNSYVNDVANLFTSRNYAISVHAYIQNTPNLTIVDIVLSISDEGNFFVFGWNQHNNQQILEKKIAARSA